MPRYTTRPQAQKFRTVHLPHGSVTIVSEAAYQRARAKANATLTRAAWDDTDWDDKGETEGREVHDDGTWSEDQPTGLLTAQGEMIFRVRRGVGFLADN